MYRLVLPPARWREEFARLVQADQRGWGYLRRVVLGEDVELIAARPVTPLEPSRHGRDFGPLDDLLLVQFSEQPPSDSAEELLDHFQPGPRQMAVAMVLGIGPAAGQWQGAVQEHGARRPLDEFLLVGPGMRRISLHPAPQWPDPQDRWSRTRGALGDRVWHRLRSSRVAIVGAGRNGSVAAFGFAMLGVRQLVLIDPDRDEWHNLDATVGATPDGLGDFKVLNRRASLLSLRPDDLEVQTLATGVPHPRVEEQLRSVDLICTCVDRDVARLVCARLANRWSKLHLDIGSGVLAGDEGQRMGGDVRLLLPGEACVMCLGGLRDAERAREEATAPPGTLRRGRRVPWHEQRAGSLLTVNHIAVHLGLQMWLSLLAGQITHSQWLHLEWTPDGLPTIQRHTASLPTCTTCRRGDAMLHSS